MATHVMHGEWIGAHVRVREARNASLVGVEGTLVDETKNMLVIETREGVKRVPKQGTTFTVDDRTVHGDKVLVAPQERIKLKVK